MVLDADFPIIMEFFKVNRLSPLIAEVHKEIGYTFLNNSCNIFEEVTRANLKRNLEFLKSNGCDLDLELFLYLRSLTFGGTLMKHGENYINVIRLLLPHCTDFFTDFNNWKKIKYFCTDTKEIIDALHFLIINYGNEHLFKYLPPFEIYNPFSLKHLSRNKTRETIWKQKRFNKGLYEFCETNLPAVLFNYICFVE